MPTRVILDTDIGTDVDDLLALTFLLGSPELTLFGITCVYGDTLLRALMVAKTLRLAHRIEIPVVPGARTSLLNRRPVYWAGHEGVGLVEPDDPPFSPPAEDASDFLIRTAFAYPGELHLIAIAPLTNLALAFIREPRLPALLAGITLMGGVVRAPDRLDLPIAEHNILCDPEAAHVVLSTCAAANVPLTIVPLDVTTQVRIQPEHVKAIRRRNTRLHNLIASQVETYPRYQRDGSTAMHDPLAVATLIDPTLITTTPVRVDVELDGSLTTGATVFRLPEDTSTLRLATGVDAERAAAFIVSRIASLEAE